MKSTDIITYNDTNKNGMRLYVSFYVFFNFYFFSFDLIEITSLVRDVHRYLSNLYLDLNLELNQDFKHLVVLNAN